MSDTTKAIFTGDRCLSCTSCMANCPVMAAVKEYRGPKLVGPAHGRMHFSQEDIEESLNYCSNCKSCDRACPSGVAVSTLSCCNVPNTTKSMNICDTKICWLTASAWRI